MRSNAWEQPSDRYGRVDRLLLDVRSPERYETSVSSSERYMLVVEEDGASSSPGQDLARSEAWDMAREIRERGARVSIMRVGSDDQVECVVRDDEPLDTLLD